MKRPSFQFYPGDWLRATDLRACSVGARGLWMDMICLMHEGTPYGHLKVGDKVILPTNLARIVGATLSEVEGWLQELKEAGVFSSDNAGCIFSRRMIKDEQVRESRASGGKLGGNPSLKVGGKVRDKVNLPANLKPTPSSASSSASADTDSGTEVPSSPPAPLPDWLPRPVWESFRQSRKKLRAPMTEEAERLSIRDLERLRNEGHDPKSVLEQSIKRGWKGLFPIKDEHQPKGQQHGRHAGFEQQDYFAGTEGFEVIGGSRGPA